MSELAEFLLARIAEDEAAAGGLVVPPRVVMLVDGASYQNMTSRAALMRPPDPRRLAECEAKRRIVEAEAGRWQVRSDSPLAEWSTDSWADRVTAHFDTGGEETMTSAQFRDRYEEPFLSDTLRLLALPYADHPDYREEWRP